MDPYLTQKDLYENFYLFTRTSPGNEICVFTPKDLYKHFYLFAEPLRAMMDVFLTPKDLYKHFYLFTRTSPGNDGWVKSCLWAAKFKA